MRLRRQLALAALIAATNGTSSSAAIAASGTSLTAFPASVSARAADAAVQAGKTVYREGLGVDGQPVQAVVAGDVPVDGRMFSCVTCHQRSGLGSVEGSVVTWPIAGDELFATRRRTGAWSASTGRQRRGAVERRALPSSFRPEDARPAYTAETLATAVRSGIAPDGRVLSRAMPRYRLDDTTMAALTAYLAQLSVDNDPGVDEKTLRFATVIGGGVSPDARESMLAVLQAHIDAHNAQTRPHLKRAGQSPFYKSEAYGAYRQFALDVWELEGAEDTWAGQLEAYYREQPVFALLGGIVEGSWSPVHAFSEKNRLPSIFPITDQPVISDTDWYTLYLSKGLSQEGESAARYLASSDEFEADQRVIQLYREGSRGDVIAEAVERAWPAGFRASLVTVAIGVDGIVPEGIFDDEPSPIVLAWLDADDMGTALSMESFETGAFPEALFASASLLNGSLNELPEELRSIVYLTHPKSLPGENAFRYQALRQWLKIRGIPELDLDIQARMFFLGWMLPGAVAHLRERFQREYFLEAFDMMSDQDTIIAVYPRLSFGPGQRYASKGGYIARIGPDPEARLSAVSDWIIH